MPKDDVPTGFNRRKFGRTGLGMEQRYEKTSIGGWRICQYTAAGVLASFRTARPNEAFIIEQLYEARQALRVPGVTRGWVDPSRRMPVSTTGVAFETLVSLSTGVVTKAWYLPDRKAWRLDSPQQRHVKVTAWQYLPRPHTFRTLRKLADIAAGESLAAQNPDTQRP